MYGLLYFFGFGFKRLCPHTFMPRCGLGIFIHSSILSYILMPSFLIIVYLVNVTAIVMTISNHNRLIKYLIIISPEVLNESGLILFVLLIASLDKC